MLLIDKVIESKRLNGYRKLQHSYLVGKIIPFQCCQLPIQLPEYFLPTQGLQPINQELLEPVTIKSGGHCLRKDCALAGLEEVAGFMWIPENEYPFAAWWFKEARNGPMFLDAFKVFLPKNLIGKFILIAHRKAIVDYSDGPFGWVDSETKKAGTTIKYLPGLFALLQITELNYIVGETKPGPKLKKLYKAYQDSGHRLIYLITEEAIELTGYAERETRIE